MKFYLCKHCGNLVGLVHDGSVPMTCCGEEMTLLVPNTVDAAAEKHVPVIHCADGSVTVDVGSTTHPMLAEHCIQWIYLQTARGGQRKNLAPGDAPQAVFALVDDTPMAAFAYCNLHGLWTAQA